MLCYNIINQSKSMLPSYLKLNEQELEKLSKKAKKLLSSCQICPRKCKINRLKGEKGVCQMGTQPVITSSGPHFGEERPLVGSRGSGTIFFTSCNLACVYCQNYDISHYGIGKKISTKELAQTMVSLQRLGCHNINFVSPSIWVPQIIEALEIAIKLGLQIPLVYNSGGYDSVETLKLLDSLIDIYMPDFKYSDSKLAKKYSQVDNYFEAAKSAIKEMHSQVGDLEIDENGIAQKGLLIRHLVLPNDLAGTKEVMDFLARISKDTYINIMDQYYPCHQADKFPELNRRITQEEYLQAVEIAKDKGLHRFDKVI